MKLLIAGGGTGGHLYPGIALAEEFRARGAEVLFVGTEKGIEVRAVPKAGFKLELVNVSGLKRVGLVKTITSVAKLPASYFQASGILSRFKPDIVVGVGGYASGPMVMAARVHGLVTSVLEQNSIPGMTNKILGKMVHRIFGTFEASKRFFPSEKFVRAGNPIRGSVLNPANAKAEGILVLGGSLGAKALNEALPGALKVAFSTVPAIPVTHQTGEKDVEETRKRYEAAGVKANVTAFIDDMGAAYASAKLCVCRAGATTCAELTALGKPSVLIPFPFAADDHQTFNARELQDAGASVMIRQDDATADALGTLVKDILSDDTRLEKMGVAARGLGKPRAAQDIADALTALCAQKNGVALTQGVQP